MAGRIADRVAIVTGGASGIGKATVELFAQEGAKVIIGDLQDSEGEKIAKEIGGTFVATDVSDPKQVERLVRTAVDKFGKLDIMYNNAGIGVTSPLLEHTDELYLQDHSHRSRWGFLGPALCGQGDGRAEARRHRQYRVSRGNSRKRRAVGLQRGEVSASSG